MDQFCKSLHPGLDVGPVCLSWFRDATAHCTDLIRNPKTPATYIWKTVKDFIFPETHTSLVSPNVPISIHPRRLSVDDCHSLFMDIVHDYILRAPRYAAESATNAMLWQILFSLMGVLALGSFLVATIYTYNKYTNRPVKKVKNIMVDLLKPETCMPVVAKRSLRIAQNEVRRLKVQHIVQREELVAPDGGAVLVLRVASKLQLFDNIVTSTVQSAGRLYRQHNEYIMKNKNEFKTELVSKAVRFLGKFPRKLRVLLVFDEDPVYEELLRRNKAKKQGIISPKSTSSTVLKKSNTPPLPRLGHVKNTSPKSKGPPPPPTLKRGSSNSSIRSRNIHPNSTSTSPRLSKTQETSSPYSTPKSSSLSTTPRKTISPRTPRSQLPVGIPRIVQKVPSKYKPNGEIDKK